MTRLQPLLDICLGNVRLGEDEDFVVSAARPGAVSAHFAEPVSFLAVGVGAAGCNALAGLGAGFPSLAVTADARIHEAALVPNRLLVGTGMLQGGGAKGQRELAQAAVSSEDLDAARKALGDRDLIVLVAGMAKGTGAGLAPVLAQQAASLGALTIGVAVMPFAHQGPALVQRSQAALAALGQECHAVVTFHNEAVSHRHPHAGSKQLLDKANAALAAMLRGVRDLVTAFAAQGHAFADFKGYFRPRASLLFTACAVDARASAKEQVEAVLAESMTGSDITGADRSVVLVTSQRGLSFAQLDRIKTQLCAAAGNVRHHCTVVERYDAQMDEGTLLIAMLCPVTHPWSSETVVPASARPRSFVRTSRPASLNDAIALRIGNAIATPPAEEVEAIPTAPSSTTPPVDTTRAHREAQSVPASHRAGN